jgi:catechol 2,3-dioxygenase-like lactoylglutathione lyase family enzyme
MWVRPLPSRKAAAMNANIEILTLPVADVDRALAFYTEKAGFTLDVDYAPTDEFRVVS